MSLHVRKCFKKWKKIVDTGLTDGNISTFYQGLKNLSAVTTSLVFVMFVLVVLDTSEVVSYVVASYHFQM